MIDKLSLMISEYPDTVYLDNNGNITEDALRSHIYKFICRLDKATVLYCPHKFSEKTNMQISYTKIDINPKNFECYDHLMAYIQAIFSSPYINSSSFHVSRVDIAADIENFSIDTLLSTLRINKIRSDNLNFYKGTIYAGTDPKIRIYDKIKEIKSRIKSNREIATYEKNLLESGRSYTRFEIQIRGVKKTLKDISENPAVFASYFDRLEIFDFKGGSDSGVLQTLYKYINRKFRNELEKFKDYNIVAEIKDSYIQSAIEWFKPAEDPF